MAQTLKSQKAPNVLLYEFVPLARVRPVGDLTVATWDAKL